LLEDKAMKVSTVEEMRALDRRAMSEYGISDHTLMENAGHAVYFVILRELGVSGHRFVVISGLGNNGGDSFVVARKIRSTGGEVHVLALGDVERYGDCARTNLEMLWKSGTKVTVQPTTAEIAGAISRSDAIIDGLLGTGITREVSGQFREVIEQVNRSRKTVFSIDIPSGVDGNTGDIFGVAVRADATITFGLPKRGNLLYPGAALGGQLFVSHISFPPQLTSADEILVALNDPTPLPPGAEDTQQSEQSAARVLIPPFEEMSRLAGVPVAAIRRDPIPIVQRVARDLEAIVVLEGARSLIGLPSRLVYINTSGNSGLPTAGSGDALKEAIGAMCGLGMPIEEAVRTGLFLYGFAGDLAAREKDRGGITARDILEHLPAATSAYREDYAGVTRGLYNTVEVV
jgi:hydroxyethylthiazole kinase-like uncharacterized protein yjeF